MTVLPDFPAHPVHLEKRAEQASRSILQWKAGCQGPGGAELLLGFSGKLQGAVGSSEGSTSSSRMTSTARKQ